MIHPACQLCRGACCEFIVLPIRLFESPENQRWFTYRGTINEIDPALLNLEVPCRHVKNGRCSIYATRPEACRVAAPGEEACLMALRHKRPQLLEKILALVEKEATVKP